MLLNAASRTARSLGPVNRSYIEIYKFVSTSLRAPSVRSLSLQGTCQARGLHSSPSYNNTPPKTDSNFIATYKQSLSFPAATHRIEDFDEDGGVPEDAVVLHGYLGPETGASKTLAFVPLLNSSLTHSIQIVSNPDIDDEEALQVHKNLLKLSQNTPVAITGRIGHRRSPPKKEYGDVTKIKTKEIVLQHVQALNHFPKDIELAPDVAIPPEQRHLQIRQDKGIRDALIFRSKVGRVCREWLNSRDFVEVETPILFKSTPEGAREFIVPTRRKGLAYALPQSPQQFKQILMSSGIPKYFQIARCFRDEDHRADRQPEFTQLDLEMAFSSGEEVMSCIEELISFLWEELLHVQLPSPFPRLSYKEAMAKYGSDKPDPRLHMEISRVGHLLPADLIRMVTGRNEPVVEAMLFQPADPETDPIVTSSFIRSFLDSPSNSHFVSNPDGGPGIFVYDATKPLQGLSAFGFEAAEEIERLLEPRNGDIIVLQARPDAPFNGGSTSLGNLRIALHQEATRQGLLPAPSAPAPLWITDFPLFSPANGHEPGQGGGAGLSATHHPFTSPKTASDINLLRRDPAAAVGDHYDLVINGQELGGGSRRIHSAAMQRFVMHDVLRMSDARVAQFEGLLDALRAGCPPHAGIALGFDRLLAVMLGRPSVRDVIAFPKSGRGEDRMTRSPGVLSDGTLRTYHLALDRDRQQRRRPWK